MKQYHELLLAVWREASRHIQIDACLASIGGLLQGQLPIEALALYVFDTQAAQCDRLCFLALSSRLTDPQPVQLDARQVRRLMAWCRTAQPSGWTEGKAPAGIPQGMIDGLGTTGLSIPLVTDHGELGLLLLASAAPCTDKQLQLAGLLREPLTVALENDRRLHELIALREAAEADKRKLLHRLGREQLTDEIIGAEGGLKAVMDRVGLVSRSDVPVLILGETGSGKEVIARAIHDGSPRAEGPFIRVNCGAIPPELIDSELFGHERGSFTGAVGDRKGWFERADGGTLFLDEIGELPAPAQVRLLRVLQDGSFERVGGGRPLHVNVRIVAATHRDLARMVQEGGFREDLWYRVAVFPIVLPPLRERGQDIPALAAHFADRAARRFGLRPQTPTAEDIALLSAYDWPGNVREFASVVDRAAILGDGHSLEVAKSLGIAPARPAALQPPASALTPVAVLTLDEAMRMHIEQALALCQGRIEGKNGVAALLDINPHTLRARMRNLGIDWQAWR
jgi:transcriptional regulator with GAF, ATPase, and Fis domain